MFSLDFYYLLVGNSKGLFAISEFGQKKATASALAIISVQKCLWLVMPGAGCG